VLEVRKTVLVKVAHRSSVPFSCPGSTALAS
jgi:hypothetical protein